MPKLRISDISIYYEVVGDGQPLLFIHGLGSSNGDWELQIPVFSKYYKVITLDLRGHGRSDKPRGRYSISMFAVDTAELIKSLGFGPMHVVGISLGGMVAIQLAINEPELVKSLVIVNSCSEVILRTFREKLIFWRRIVLVQLLGMRKTMQVLSKILFPNFDQKHLRSEFVGRWKLNDKHAYISAYRAIAGWSVTESLGSISCPILVVNGDRDFFYKAAKDDYASKMQDAEIVVIPNSGHATPVDQPETFNAILKKFLLKHS